LLLQPPGQTAQITGIGLPGLLAKAILKPDRVTETLYQLLIFWPWHSTLFDSGVIAGIKP
jgi:hypothetical protein